MVNYSTCSIPIPVVSSPLKRKCKKRVFFSATSYLTKTLVLAHLPMSFAGNGLSRRQFVVKAKFMSTVKKGSCKSLFVTYRTTRTWIYRKRLGHQTFVELQNYPSDCRVWVSYALVLSTWSTSRRVYGRVIWSYIILVLSGYWVCILGRSHK